MQKFKVILEVTVNTVQAVSPAEIRETVKDLVDDVDFGNVSVEIVEEV